MNVGNRVSSVFQSETPNFVPSESRTSSVTVQDIKFYVPRPRSVWFSELKHRFDELTALPRGWDGYAGRPVSFQCAQFTAHLIERLFVEGVPAPQLVPGGDGTVQFEWHRNQYDVEIDVLAPYEVLAVRRDLRNNQTVELELQTDFAPLGNWISDLATNRL